AFVRSASTTAVLPFTNWPGGIGITTSSANIAVRPDTRSVFALAAENARSAASSSSTTLCGVTAAVKTSNRHAIALDMLLLCRDPGRGYNRDTRAVGRRSTSRQLQAELDR